ncbi:MAG: DUF4124 domain-containing protein [Rhodanobacteraceae bacterium]
MCDRSWCQRSRRGGPRRARLLAVLLMWFVAAGAVAAPVYRCTDAQGHVAFQDAPCPTSTQQEKRPLVAQPLIGSPGERTAEAPPSRRQTATPRLRKRAPRAAAKPPMAWECRVADGEVFYQHTRCPASVPGDGEVRVRFADRAGWKRKPKREHARGRLPVHGVPVTRAEACRRMEPVRAAGRDGHLRDQRASTYDRLMGRDPCSNQ